MKCEDFLSLLPMAPDDVPKNQTDAFVKHVEECVSCKEQWERHQSMLSMLHSLDEHLETPVDLHERWTAAVYSKNRKKREKNSIYYRVIGLAASVIVILGTILMREGVIFSNMEYAGIGPVAVVEPMMANESVTRGEPNSDVERLMAAEPMMTTESVAGGETNAATESLADVELITTAEPATGIESIMQSRIGAYGQPSGGMFSGVISDAADTIDSDWEEKNESPEIYSGFGMEDYNETSVLDESSATLANEMMAAPRASLAKSDVYGEPEGKADHKESGVLPARLRSVSFEIESASFDQTLLMIEETVEKYQGITEYLSVSAGLSEDGVQYASITIRAPGDLLNELANDLHNVGDVTARHETTEDISVHYREILDQIAVCESQIAALRQLAQNTGVSDQIAIESRISELQMEISSLTARNSGYDERSIQAVLYVSVMEKKTARSATLFSRAFHAFLDSIRAVPGFFADLLVFVSYIAPYVACVVIISLVVALIRKIKNKQSV